MLVTRILVRGSSHLFHFSIDFPLFFELANCVLGVKLFSRWGWHRESADRGGHFGIRETESLLHQLVFFEALD